MTASNSQKRKHKKDLGAVPSAPPAFSLLGRSWTLCKVKNRASINAGAASTCGKSSDAPHVGRSDGDTHRGGCCHSSRRARPLPLLVPSHAVSANTHGAVSSA